MFVHKKIFYIQKDGWPFNAWFPNVGEDNGGESYARNPLSSRYLWVSEVLAPKNLPVSSLPKPYDSHKFPRSTPALVYVTENQLTISYSRWFLFV